MSMGGPESRKRGSAEGAGVGYLREGVDGSVEVSALSGLVPREGEEARAARACQPGLGKLSPGPRLHPAPPGRGADSVLCPGSAARREVAVNPSPPPRPRGRPAPTLLGNH